MGRLNVWRHEVLSVWRDIDSEQWKYGVYFGRHGITAYVARRCYRASWWKP
jgi:hypothetical protein